MGIRLHVGCGPNVLPGWTNVDVAPGQGVDLVLDVREGLPYSDVSLIFAEHFLEHLTLDEAAGFLAECRRALAPDGVLRLTTPNLDWVWATHYRTRWRQRGASSAVIELDDWRHDEDSAIDGILLNRAFRAWGHRFLWNRALLEVELRRAGFRDVASCEYGASDHPELRGLERHERYDDSPRLRHILVVEASGTAAPPATPRLAEARELFRRDTVL